MRKIALTFAITLLYTASFAGSDPLKSTSVRALNLQEVVSKMEYPKESNLKGIEGIVLMKLKIDEQGHVTAKTAISYPCNTLKVAVEQAVDNLQFEPARNGLGMAVASSVKIPFAFELEVE